jgi:hypothetical protein
MRRYVLRKTCFGKSPRRATAVKKSIPERGVPQTAF